MKRQFFGILIALVLLISFGFTVPASATLPPIEVFVDVKPMSCPNPLNVRSRGVLPVAILGTEDFDVTTVDPDTIRLNLVNPEPADVSPLRWSYEDVATPHEANIFDCHDDGPDGILDLVLMFRTPDVVELDLLRHDDGEVVALQITGNLKEGATGSPIRGQDVIVVINKMINGDG